MGRRPVAVVAGVPKDMQRACELWTAAMTQGHAEAQCHLGVVYSNGIGVPKDMQRACELWTVAATQAHESVRISNGFYNSMNK